MGTVTNMTLYQIIVYALLSSTGVGDSERMAVVIHHTYAETPTLDLVSAGQQTAPECPTGGLCITSINSNQ